jgi:hypothetical protein
MFSSASLLAPSPVSDSRTSAETDFRAVCGHFSGQAALSFQGTQRFSIVSTGSHHWTLSWVSYWASRLSGTTPYSRGLSSYLGVQTGCLDWGVSWFLSGHPDKVQDTNPSHGCAIAQAVSRWLPTAAAPGSRPGRACGVCGGQSGTSVSPANHHSTNFSIIITRGWHNRPIGGRSAEWTQLDSTPYYSN